MQCYVASKSRTGTKHWKNGDFSLGNSASNDSYIDWNVLYHAFMAFLFSLHVFECIYCCGIFPYPPPPQKVALDSTVVHSVIVCGIDVKSNKHQPRNNPISQHVHTAYVQQYTFHFTNIKHHLDFGQKQIAIASYIMSFS